MSDEMTDTIVRAMRQAGVREEIIYAFQKTGRLVTSENAKYLTREELVEWEAAIDEYRAREIGERTE